jgi:hypothetical protein
MSHKHELPTPTDDHDKKLLADVKKYGWHVIGVEEDEVGPGVSVHGSSVTAVMH